MGRRQRDFASRTSSTRGGSPVTPPVTTTAAARMNSTAAAVAGDGGLARGEFRQLVHAKLRVRRARQRADVNHADDGLGVLEQIRGHGDKTFSPSFTKTKPSRRPRSRA